MNHLVLHAALGAALLASAPTIIAQTYPVKPIRLMVPFPPGGSTDIVARIVALRLSERLGQPIVIENRGGAGGTIGTALVAKAAPDGYSLVFGTTSTHAVAPAVYPKLDYDPIKDFAPVGMVAVTPYLLVVNPAFKATNVREFVALAKAQPGKLNYASAGTGSTTHLAMEMLKSQAGYFMLHIPYAGNGPAGIAVVSGQVEALFGSMPALLSLAQSGKVRALAVGTSKRSPSLPDVPTVSEAGFAGFEASLWLAVMAPAGTPAPIIERLSTELAAVVGARDAADALSRAGAEPWSTTARELGDIVRAGVAKYAKVVKAANVKAE